jgi:hypothetical protein
MYNVDKINRDINWVDIKYLDKFQLKDGEQVILYGYWYPTFFFPMFSKKMIAEILQKPIVIGFGNYCKKINAFNINNVERLFVTHFARINIPTPNKKGLWCC